MDKPDKVKVSICGRSFYLTSKDDPGYLINIADKTDNVISGLMQNNIGLTFEQAAVLTALKYCDDYEKKLMEEKKQSSEEENLGKRLVKYSKELTRATARIKALEKELDKIRKEQEDK